MEGGLGTMVVEAVAQEGLTVPVYKHGLYDEFGIVGPPTHLYRYYGMDGARHRAGRDPPVRAGCGSAQDPPLDG